MPSIRKPKFSVAHPDIELVSLVEKTDQETLALWAIECARRVLPFFEEKFPNDQRPGKALVTLQEWITTGLFSMKVIRKASLDSHAAARGAEEDSPARSAARACGQCVATAHVPRHAYGAAIYAQQAIFNATDGDAAPEAAKKERNWQYKRLQELI